MWTGRVGAIVGLKTACGYSAEDRAAIAGLRRKLSVVLLVFLSMNLLVGQRLHGLPGIFVAAIEGLSFAAIIVLAWLIAMRSGDEYGRELMRRSLLWGLGITMLLTCVVGYLQLVLDLAWHVPMLMTPLCLILSATVAKLIVFRRARV